MRDFLHRFRDASFPYSGWHPFPPNAIVQVKNSKGQTNIGPAKSFWWGYEQELGVMSEGVITECRRLDHAKKS